MEKGYALFLVKPTLNRNLTEEFEVFLRERGYTILETVSKRLTTKQVTDNFFGILKLNIDYLTSGEIYALWCAVESEDVSEDVYEAKMLFREKHGINEMQLDNLVHSSDDGLEMMLQKQVFFPHYSNGKYARGCDMYVDVSSFRHAADVHHLLGEGIKSICVLIESEKDQEIVIELSNKYQVSIIKRQAYGFWDGKTGYLLYYYKDIANFSDALSCQKVVVDFPEILISKSRWNQWSGLQDYASFYSQVKKFYFASFDQYKKELKEKGIQVDGVLVEKGNDCLLEANCRYFYAMANKLLMSAGSGEKKYIGQYYMPESFERDFWEGKR